MFFFCFSETRVNVVVEEKVCLFCLLSNSCLRVHTILFFVKWIRNNFFLENSAFHLALSRNFVCFCFVASKQDSFFCHSTSHLGFQRTNSTNFRFFLFCFVSKQLNRKKLFFTFEIVWAICFTFSLNQRSKTKKLGNLNILWRFFSKDAWWVVKGTIFFLWKKTEFFCLFRKLSKSQGWQPFLEGPEQTTVAG